MALTLETSYIQDALESKYPEGREEEKTGLVLVVSC